MLDFRDAFPQHQRRRVLSKALKLNSDTLSKWVPNRANRSECSRNSPQDFYAKLQVLLGSFPATGGGSAQTFPFSAAIANFCEMLLVFLGGAGGGPELESIFWEGEVPFHMLETGEGLQSLRLLPQN